MITPEDEELQNISKKTSKTVQHLHDEELPKPIVSLAQNTAIGEAQSSVLLNNKFVTHTEKSGLNPLADAAAYIFSVIGKLKQLKFYRNLSNLHKELVAEINTFQDTAKTLGYTPEYILVSRYALCATLDDIITNTPWGAQGQWDSYSLLTTFNQENSKQEKFYLILERIIKDPAVYIDVMELMYICLSLGFKGGARTTEFSNTQVEQITHALYKQIRAYRGNFSKILSPFPIRSINKPKAPVKKTSVTTILAITIGIIVIVFLGLGYLLEIESNQSFRELMSIGKLILYESHNI